MDVNRMNGVARYDTPGAKAWAHAALLVVALLPVLASLPTGAKTTVPMATVTPYSVRMFNTDAWAKTGELRFTPTGLAPGGTADIVQRFTVPGYNTQEFSFPSAAGQLVQTPDSDPVTGQPYPELAMDVQTTDNGKIQAPVALDDLSNAKPLVGGRGQNLLISAGPNGMQALIYSFSPGGLAVATPQTILANGTSYFTVDSLVGSGTDPIAVEVLSGSGLAVMKDACNGEYRRLTATDVSPRVAKAVAGWLADTKGTYLFSKTEVALLAQDPVFVHNLYDPAAQAIFGNETALQNFLLQGTDGVKTTSNYELADRWAFKIVGTNSKMKFRGAPGKAVLKWNKVSAPPYVTFGPSASTALEQGMLTYLQSEMAVVVQNNLATYAGNLQSNTNPWK